jgi:hypothetical protein
MRRIYESSAVHRDDDDPQAPGEDAGDVQPQAMRTIDGEAWSRRLVPDRLRHYAVSVGVEPRKAAFSPGEQVSFRVTMANAMPFPVTIETRSPLLWTWSVDGVQEAAHVPLHDPPSEPRGFRFGRGERKQFVRTWHQQFQTAAAEWEPAEPGEHNISVALNVADAAEKGLAAETTVELLAE